MFINITNIRYENIKGTDAASIDKIARSLISV